MKRTHCVEILHPSAGRGFGAAERAVRPASADPPKSPKAFLIARDGAGFHGRKAELRHLGG